MSAYPAPSNGYFTGATYNSAFFVESDSSDTVTKEYLAENYLPRTGNPTDEAETTTFAGEIIEDSNIILAGTQGTQYIQFPNTSKQYTAMNTLTASSTFNYATIKTDSNGAISSVTSGSLPSYSSTKVALAYGTYSSSYTSFTINTSSGGTTGSWSQNQFFTIRYTISVNYNASSSSPYQFQSYGMATGTMDIYPYRFGSNWCASANQASLAQLPNAINGNSKYWRCDK